MHAQLSGNPTMVKCPPLSQHLHMRMRSSPLTYNTIYRTRGSIPTTPSTTSTITAPTKCLSVPRPCSSQTSRNARPCVRASAIDGETIASLAIASIASIAIASLAIPFLPRSESTDGTGSGSESTEGSVSEAEPIEGSGSESEPIEGSVSEAEPIEESLSSMAAALEVTVQVIQSIDGVSKEEWDAVACANGEVNPFVLYDFLNALEKSGSAVRSKGWGPSHLLVRDKRGKLLGCAPLYLKAHSYGEYV
eukprot:gene10730-17806_t